MQNFKILSYNEEKQLSNSELIEYYKNLKEFLKCQNSGVLNDTLMTIRRNLNKTIVRGIINNIKGYELSISGQENIPDSPVIYASTHQDYHDHFNIVLAMPDHSIILNTDTVTRLFKLIMGVNGIIYVDRNDSQSRFQSKIDLMSVLAKGESIAVFPEASWNCSPNKLHLPLYSGVIDMAKKMQVPIVPLIQEYEYDGENPTYKCVKSCQIVFGKPIYVSYFDKVESKREELSDQFATIRWNLIEQKGVFKRTNITNQEYINYVLSRIDGWRQTKVELDKERPSVKGYGTEQYLFTFVNDVAFDNKGNLLLPSELLKLEEINRQHLDICTDRDGKVVDINKVLTLSRTKV